MAGLPPFITLDDLDRMGPAPRIVDLRWSLDGTVGRDDHFAGHLPGAVYADLDTDLAAPATRADGRHPLPDPASFANAMRRLGIDDDTPVVAHDTVGGGIAARLVWMLRVLDHDASVLVLTADELAARAVSGAVEVPLGTFTQRVWPDAALASADDVAAAAASGDVAVLDARDAARFRGETEPVDARAGHVPGAHNRPWTASLRDGRLLATDELRDVVAPPTGANDAIVHCGSGVTACHLALAIEAAELPRPRLFVGSWSAWSADPARPVATGSA